MIHWPSGDHEGAPWNVPSSSIRTAAPPDTGAIQTEKLPPPQRWNASCRPSVRGFAASIRSLEITDGSFRIDASDDSEDLELTGIDLMASVDVAAGGHTIASRGEVALAGLSLTALDLYRETLDTLHPSLRYDLEFRAADGTLHLEELALAQREAEHA